MDEHDGNGHGEFNGESRTEPNAGEDLLRATLRDLGDYHAAIGRNLAQVELAIGGLSPAARRVCFAELERICRDIGELGHLTARAIHDARMEL